MSWVKALGAPSVKFVGDNKLGGNDNPRGGRKALQRELNRLHRWAGASGMSSNDTKRPFCSQNRTCGPGLRPQGHPTPLPTHNPPCAAAPPGGGGEHCGSPRARRRCEAAHTCGPQSCTWAGRTLVHAGCTPTRAICAPTCTDSTVTDTECTATQTECTARTDCAPVHTERTPVHIYCTLTRAKCTVTPMICTLMHTECTPTRTECTPTRGVCSPVLTECTPTHTLPAH